MSEVPAAESRRREREWLRVEFDDAARTAAFEQAKRELSLDRGPTRALIAVGEFRAARSLIPESSSAAEFLANFSEYFMASGDDAFARALVERLGAALRSTEAHTAQALHGVVAAAEAIGDRALAAEASAPLPVAGVLPAPSHHPVVSVVYDELGYAPDAPKGRLQLRPLITRSMQSLRVENIHIGDALVALLVERQPDAVRFEATQTAGAVPVRLILEPILEFAVRSARVDGVEASLTFRPVGDLVVVPVQIVLDEVREVLLS